MSGTVDRPTSVLVDVSQEMIRIYKSHFGRGPTRARTEWAGADILVATLENTLTPAERRLVQMGEHQRLRDVRLFFQHASETELVVAVERASGRTVRAYVSGLDIRADIASELFYLFPVGDPSVSISQRATVL
jgi:uncharacterized protein YbcI